MEDRKPIIVLIVIIALLVSLSNILGPSIPVKKLTPRLNLHDLPDPIQTTVLKDKLYRTSNKECDFTLKCLADYEIIAKVVSKKHYHESHRPEPYDILVVWGMVADSKFSKYFAFFSSGRKGIYTYKGDTPFDREYIGTHTANMHIIPSSPHMAEQFNKIKKRQIIELKGCLVEVTMSCNKHFGKYSSSLTRRDHGDGACEVMYVTEISEVR